MLKHNIKQLFIALNQLLNVILSFPFEMAWADETLSSHSYRLYSSGRLCWPRTWIDWVADKLGDKNHCYESYVSERTARQLPPELRRGI